MNTAKIDRALYGPSIFEVTLGAVLSILVGLAIAAVFLVLRPVVVAAELPKEEERDRGTIYYLEGRGGSSNKAWIRKRQMLMEGTPGEIAFTEEELNGWFASGSKPAKKPVPPPRPGVEAPAEPVPDEVITVDLPNVRIRDGVFQLGIPAHLNPVFVSLPVFVQARGGFAEQDGMWMFAPTEVYLGSMPLHRIPGFTEGLMNRLLKSDLIPPDAVEAWKRVRNVTVDGKQLKVVIE